MWHPDSLHNNTIINNNGKNKVPSFEVGGSKIQTCSYVNLEAEFLKRGLEQISKKNEIG